MKQQKIKYKRILLKISGESLSGKNSSGVDHDTVLEISKSVKKCYDLGVEPYTYPLKRKTNVQLQRRL